MNYGPKEDTNTVADRGQKLVVGREEWVSLSELGLHIIKAKVDSGAKTSALHAFNIHTYSEGQVEFVRFDVHPIQNNRQIIERCHAPLVDHRTVKSSNGDFEKRYVIRTLLSMGDQSWSIEVTLTNRDSMGCRMLLGREAMTKKLLVDPDALFISNNMCDAEAIRLYKPHKQSRRPLKIVVLGSDPDLYSNQRLMEAGTMRGHEMLFIKVRYCYMNISGLIPEIYYSGKKLDGIDAVIPRLRPSMTFYGCAITRQFQTSGVFCLNDAVSISKSRDKLHSLQLLVEKGISMPITSFAHSQSDTKHLIKMVGGAPLVVKLLEGAQGTGVVLAETNKAAESVITAFKSLKANILVQQFIKEAKGEDYRAFVVDGKVVSAMNRTAGDAEEFRANLHLGGTCSPAKLTQEEKRMAVTATKVLGLRVAGVDIIRSSNGPKILEVNSSPGLRGIEEATGEDVASIMIEAVERYTNPQQKISPKS